ncbi:hypothetical protein SAY87_027324 [Trapa incisa]|uniref:Uncharacterized protein n=1 Tax=Trapa incisa TaxID=236973 RepID=A0AAN7JMA5_9MYRT|nr:hypothetical protein SAY87_027324 [Trapa incisa]
MPAPAFAFSSVKVASDSLNSSTIAGDFSFADESAASQTSRPRVVRVRRHPRSRTARDGRQSQDCDSVSSAPTDSAKLKAGDSESNGTVSSRSHVTPEVSSYCSFNGAGMTSELKTLNSLGNGGVTGKEAYPYFVFGSSQSNQASLFNLETNGFSEQFRKLNLGDNLRTEVVTAAGTQEGKLSDSVFNFNLGVSVNPDNGLESGTSVFNSNTIGSSIDDEAAASFDLGKNQHDAAKNDGEQENIFVFGSKCNLSSQPSGISSIKPSMFMFNSDPSFLCSEPMESNASKKSRPIRIKRLQKRGKRVGPPTFDSSMEKQYFPEEGNAEENPSTSNCYSPMEFSPYQEDAVDNQSSHEKQTSDHMGGCCSAKMSFMAESYMGKADVSGRSGDETGKATSGPAQIGTFAGTASAACQSGSAAHPPESDHLFSDSIADNSAQFLFSSRSKNSDHGRFTFSASGRCEHYPRRRHLKPTFASSSTSQGAAVENKSSSLEGQSGHTPDREVLSKEAPRVSPKISRKPRPRLVKLRKHPHVTASTQEKSSVLHPFSAVRDGLLQVNLNYADASDSNNSAIQEVNCSDRDASSSNKGLEMSDISDYMSYGLSFPPKSKPIGSPFIRF